MIKRLVTLLILVPIGVVVIALAVANRQPVDVTLPLEVAGQPMVLFTVPLFVLAFLMVFLGMVIGSTATWFSQGKHRKSARAAKVEATKQGFEAQKHKERAQELSQTANTATGANQPALTRS
ncbi:MAG: LapA family protein [Pseudomonadota bacterium]